MEKKFEMTDNTKKVWNEDGEVITCHQIRALKDFAPVKAGDLGGYIEKEENLSQDGSSWVYDNACVYGNARIRENAWVYDNACVYGNAYIYGNAQVGGNARIYGNAEIYDNAKVYDNATVCDNAKVYGEARIRKNAWVCDNAYDNVYLCSNASIADSGDFIVIQGIFKAFHDITIFRCRDKSIKVRCENQRFSGTLEEFKTKIDVSDEEYSLIVKLIESHFKIIIMEDKKYELTDVTRKVGDRTLYQIRALKDFGDVKAGDLGGYIEKEENLSQEDNAWVYDKACVYDNAHIYDCACVCGNAQVYGEAKVYDNARVYEKAQVCEYAYVCGNARVCGNAIVRENAWVYGDAKVYGNAINI